MVKKKWMLQANTGEVITHNGKVLAFEQKNELRRQSTELAARTQVLMNEVFDPLEGSDDRSDSEFFGNIFRSIGKAIDKYADKDKANKLDTLTLSWVPYSSKKPKTTIDFH